LKGASVAGGQGCGRSAWRGVSPVEAAVNANYGENVAQAATEGHDEAAVGFSSGRAFSQRVSPSGWIARNSDRHHAAGAGSGSAVPEPRLADGRRGHKMLPAILTLLGRWEVTHKFAWPPRPWTLKGGSSTLRSGCRLVALQEWRSRAAVQHQFRDVANRPLARPPIGHHCRRKSRAGGAFREGQQFNVAAGRSSGAVSHVPPQRPPLLGPIERQRPKHQLPADDAGAAAVPSPPTCGPGPGRRAVEGDS